MSLKCLHRYSLLILIALLPLSLLAQSEADNQTAVPGVEIVTSVDRSESYIGDRIKYQVSITYDSSYELVPPPLGANLGAFEVKDYEPDQETILEDGRIRSLTKFVLSSFVVGDYVIPPLPVQFVLPDSTRKIVYSEPVPIKILTLLEEGADTLNLRGGSGAGALRGLKKPYVFERDYINYYIYGSLLILLIVGLIFWYVWRKRRLAGDSPKDLRPPWELAFEKLALLKEKGLAQDSVFKLYYFELTELTREFLGRNYEMDILEMTTDEFKNAFADIAMPGEMYNKTLEFMKHADLVKFARFSPELKRAEADYLFVYELISDLRDETLSRLQAEQLAKAARREPVDPEQPVAVAAASANLPAPDQPELIDTIPPAIASPAIKSDRTSKGEAHE